MEGVYYLNNDRYKNDKLYYDRRNNNGYRREDKDTRARPLIMSHPFCITQTPSGSIENTERMVKNYWSNMSAVVVPPNIVK